MSHEEALVLDRSSLVSVLADVGYQPNWPDVVSSGFMRNAFIGGALVAVAAGALGYFVVVRQHAFAAHALAHIGFPGATLALLLGLFGKQLADRDIATGTILAFATGLGLLFNSLSTRSSNSVINVLFGNLLAISSQELIVYVVFTAALVVVVTMIGRPLVFASVNPLVAEARGVPVALLNIAFLVLLALVITMSVQVVGTLLLFGLVVTPAATALAVTARPMRVVLLTTAIALGAVALGLVLAAMFNLPPSFLIVSITFVAWIASYVATRGTRRRKALVHDQHH
jgi:zinc/manganese transport system permease protein